MSLYTTLDAARLCREIDSAKQHVIYAAPGLTKVIAEALFAAWIRCERRVVAVLDVSTQVAHLGYGDFEPVKWLQSTGVDVRDHHGLRLGVLICDNHGWTFATAPRLVEADTTANSDAFNAIALTEAQIIALRAELPPVTQPPHAPQAALDLFPVTIVGEKPLGAVQVEKVASDLAVAPARNFDLARRMNVYVSMVQFVELELEGFNLQSREVRLPPTLPLLATKDENLKKRISATLKVLGKSAPPLELSEIKSALETLRKHYLKPVGRLGRVILKRDLPEFERKLRLVDSELEKCREKLIADLHGAIERAISDIGSELAAVLMEAPPFGLRMEADPPEFMDALDYAHEQLWSCMPDSAELVEGMRIHCFYKDVTYELLKDQDFVKRLVEQLPEDMKANSLIVESIAAAESVSKEETSP